MVLTSGMSDVKYFKTHMLEDFINKYCHTVDFTGLGQCFFWQPTKSIASRPAAGDQTAGRG